MQNQKGIMISKSDLTAFVESARNLENLITRYGSGISKENDMLQRTRVMIGYDDDGYPIYKQIKAQDTDSLNDRIIQSYIDSGRIWDFMPQNNQPKPETKTLFRPFAEEFRERFKVPKLKPRSLEEYDKVLFGKLIPIFGSRPIEEITTADIQDFLNQHKEKARSTLTNWLAILKPVLRYAAQQGIIPRNPADSMDLFIPSDKVTKRTALTEEQYSSVLAQINQMKDSYEKTAIATICYTGMRRGEMLGLRWEDIDFENAVIHIRRSIKHSHNQPLLEDTTTKTKSGIRDIPLLKSLADILRPMCGNGYILGGDKPLTGKKYETIRKHICKQLNLYGATEHVFRHTFLTQLSGTGVDLKTLQTYAGHAQSQTTMDIYAHPQVGKIKNAGDQMEALLHNLAEKGANIQERVA